MPKGDIAIRLEMESGPFSLVFFERRHAAERSYSRLSGVNRLIVQCAEDLVLYRDDRAWIESFVAKNCRYRVEPVTQTLKHDGGDLIVATHRIQARPE